MVGSRRRVDSDFLVSICLFLLVACFWSRLGGFGVDGAGDRWGWPSVRLSFVPCRRVCYAWAAVPSPFLVCLCLPDGGGWWVGLVCVRACGACFLARRALACRVCSPLLGSLCALLSCARGCRFVSPPLPVPRAFLLVSLYMAPCSAARPLLLPPLRPQARRGRCRRGAPKVSRFWRIGSPYTRGRLFCLYRPLMHVQVCIGAPLRAREGPRAKVDDATAKANEVVGSALSTAGDAVNGTVGKVQAPPLATAGGSAAGVSTGGRSARGGSGPESAARDVRESSGWHHLGTLGG